MACILCHEGDQVSLLPVSEGLGISEKPRRAWSPCVQWSKAATRSGVSYRKAVSQALFTGVSLVEILCIYPFKRPRSSVGMRLGTKKHTEVQRLCWSEGPGRLAGREGRVLFSRDHSPSWPAASQSWGGPSPGSPALQRGPTKAEDGWEGHA